MKVKVIYLFFLFVFSFNCSKYDEATIKLSVTGTSNTANISYKTTVDGNMDDNRTVELLNESIPWEYTFKVINKGSGDDTYTAEFCATLIEDGTSIVLQIFADDQIQRTEIISNLNEMKCAQLRVKLEGVWGGIWE